MTPNDPVPDRLWTIRELAHDLRYLESSVVSSVHAARDSRRKRGKL
jgi:hypothetical protein